MVMRKESALLSVLVALGLTAGAGAATPEPEVIVAAKAGDVAAVRALVERKADVNARETDGTTALHWAVRVESQPTVDVLVKAGADVNAVNRYGVTPLAVAAKAGRAAVLEALLKAGARIKEAEAGLPEGQTLLMHAARVGDVASLRVLLAAGTAIDARETRTGTTALVWAAADDRAAAVRLLAEAGADLNVVSKVTAYPHTKSGVGLTGLEEGVRTWDRRCSPAGDGQLQCLRRGKAR